MRRLCTWHRWDDRARAERRADGLCQSLAAVDDEEHRAIGPESSSREVREQTRATRRVLRGSFVEAENVLLSLLVDAEGDEHDMLVDVNAVDHHGAERETGETASHHLREVLARRGDEAAADGALARAARRDPRRCGLDRARVLPRRHADHHLFDGA